jgi:site-specific DNA-methyltransferase (cytosine-N4-specific)
MYWLGFDPIAVRTSEIGARPHYSRRNGLTEHDFVDQMADVFDELVRVLAPGAPIVVVVGDSVIRGRQVDNRDTIEAAATRHGVRVLVAVERPIMQSRSSFNRAHSRARKSEHVLLLQSPR